MSEILYFNVRRTISRRFYQHERNENSGKHIALKEKFLVTMTEIKRTLRQVQEKETKKRRQKRRIRKLNIINIKTNNDSDEKKE